MRQEVDATRKVQVLDEEPEAAGIREFASLLIPFGLHSNRDLDCANVKNLLCLTALRSASYRGRPLIIANTPHHKRAEHSNQCDR